MSKSYELVRYTGLPFAQTHPDRLATMARLFGMTPTPIQHARVLEIGCCDGGNLIPMAYSLPESEFVGIDLTEPDIASARETAASLGLTNIQFQAFDLTQLPGPFAKFDYTIAHGVYSWVPAEVREKLLAVIDASLTPHGVAYVSYNTMPGGHLRLMIREMMQFHVRGVEDPKEILAKSRQLLEFIAASSGRNSEYEAFITTETEHLFSRPDYGLFHDELEENYHPVYFHEFLTHAARYGLQYLSEANYFDMRPDLPAAADSPVLQAVSGDPVLREQYLDFARCRRFRQTLICHQDVPIQRAIQPELFQGMFFASPAHQVNPPEGSAAGTEEFHGPQNSKIRTGHPDVLRIVHRLVSAWPMALHYDDLKSEGSDQKVMCEILQALFSSGLLEVRTAQPRMAVVPSERPTASTLARAQAARGVPVTTLRHVSITATGDVERRLISLLDGTRTRAELVSEISPLLTTSKTAAELKSELETSLTTLGRLGLLTS
jgi:trans-aconitate methyltransferase